MAEDGGGAKQNAPIIKKVKKVAGGHHGGAWKIAYADFVTAMMAFFLLLWLLSSTPSQTLQGIADYFSPTIGLKDKMGIGFYGGKTPLEEGNSRDVYSHEASIMYGVPTSGPSVEAPKKNQNEQEAEVQRFEQIKIRIEKALEDHPELKKFRDNIRVIITQDGLRISIIDQDKISMFEIGSTTLKPHTKLILNKIGEVIKNVPNRISVSGHTDSHPFVGNGGYSNWELSADRANASRRYLQDIGIDKDKIARVVGRADKEHLVASDPYSPINRRISITLLHKSIAPYSEKAAPDEFFESKDINKEKYLKLKSGEDAQKPEIKIDAGNIIQGDMH